MLIGGYFRSSRRTIKSDDDSEVRGQTLHEPSSPLNIAFLGPPWNHLADEGLLVPVQISESENKIGTRTSPRPLTMSGRHSKFLGHPPLQSLLKGVTHISLTQGVRRLEKLTTTDEA